MLVRLTYQTTIAGNVTAFSFTVPFGISSENKAEYGAALWDQSTFLLANTLIQCTRFCSHPTFDPFGVYQVNSPFNPTFLSQCYTGVHTPKFPTPLDLGYPSDP